MFGSEEQRRKWLPMVAKDHISAFLLTEPGVGSDPARMASTATPVPEMPLAGRRRHSRDADRGRLQINGPQAVGDERDGRRHRRRDGEGAQERRPPRRDQRVRVPYNTEGITIVHRNAFMGLRGIENSVTILKEVSFPRRTGSPARATGSRSRSAR